MRPWIAAAALLAGWPAAAALRGNTVRYRCDDGQIVQATYFGVDRAEVSLAGRTYRLRNAMAGSGARYVGAGLSLWEHHGEAEIEIDGRTIRCR
ncbi:MliC family protein [uncultured Methylobacterium sp.]|uniref:MliC family protein n=1 Tax=uncultured Methylobacterium sp. TaxID=157278 RepID=UPI0035CAF715